MLNLKLQDLIDPEEFYQNSKKNNPFHPRRSGRTTAIMLQAIKDLQQNPDSVCTIIGYSYTYTKDLQDELRELAYESGVDPDRVIKVRANHNTGHIGIGRWVYGDNFKIYKDHHQLSWYAEEGRSNPELKAHWSEPMWSVDIISTDMVTGKQVVTVLIPENRIFLKDHVYFLNIRPEGEEPTDKEDWMEVWEASKTQEFGIIVVGLRGSDGQLRRVAVEALQKDKGSCVYA